MALAVVEQVASSKVEQVELAEQQVVMLEAELHSVLPVVVMPVAVTDKAALKGAISLMNIIELKDITKTYRRGDEDLPILRNISLTVADGDFVAIIGPSGSGKSTLMNTIGLLDVPTSGSYTLDGVVTERMSDNELAELRNQKIGFIFQQFNLLPRLTAMENVELPMIYAGIAKKERKERANAMLKMLGMGERGHHRPSELSGGQQQRVAIARALAISPR